MFQNRFSGHIEPPIFFHLKWVAKISLGVGAVATIGLLLVLFLIVDDEGKEYSHIILSHSLTRQNLALALLVFGLAIVVITSIITWFISLYSSFRIAGPLFRFSQNLKKAIEDVTAVPIAIRQTDLLQQEWNEFDASQATLRAHYRNLREALEQAQLALQASDEFDAVSLRQALAKLQEVERHVQL